MSELTEVLAKPAPLVWRGKELACEPFDLNDLADLEFHISDLSLLDLSKFEHQRLLLWLTFRRIDPRLSADEKDNLRYRMTLPEAGRLVTARDYQEGKIQPFLESVLKLSGLQPEGEADAGNAAAPEEAAARPARKAKAAKVPGSVA